MFLDIGAPEIIVILIVAIIILGPEKLPEAGRTVGRVMRDFRSMTSDLTKDFREPIEDISRYRDWDAWNEDPEPHAEVRSSQQDDTESESTPPRKRNRPGPV